MSETYTNLDRLISILKEIGVYLLTGLVFFLIVSLPAFFYPSPDTSTPIIEEPPPERTVPTVEVRPPPAVPLDILNIIFWVIAILGMIVVAILVLMAARKIQIDRTPREKVPSLKEKVRKLKFSRDEAIRILQECLISGEYSKGIVDAFHVLDEQLDNFRKIARPKHWTPKEYAIGVTEPVFKPSAYTLVKIFYRVQYGQMAATKDDVLQSLDALEHLFIDENPPEKREQMNRWFEEEISTIRQWEIIPRQGDLLKPKPRKKSGGKNP